jgi:putative membrane protein
MLRIILAGIHLLALGLGLGAVLARGTALREKATGDALHRAFRMDTLWGIAAALWLATGLWRLLAGVEKPTSYYTGNHLFMLKMGLFVLVVALEVGPALTLVRWRSALRRGGDPAVVAPRPAAQRIAMISHVEALLVVVMIFVAVAMARGFGMGQGGT